MSRHKEPTEVSTTPARDDRMKYWLYFEAPGHKHDALFLSLDEAEAFVGNYIVKHKLRAQDVMVDTARDHLKALP